MNDIEDINCIPTPTTAESGAIKAITKDTVHKICSGQVVLSLAVAVKELVENAIDAGATLVEVKLRDQGLESVEVSDNGSGVEERNLLGMTAKYHTSKIRQFVDLQDVETFGFRGEALSSLCALSDMVIQTRHQSTDVGIKIELDHEGKITKKTPCARGSGTTVTLSNLFVTLPVRRRDFVRNIKKEFTKMCQILQAYCLVTKGVRIICSNQTPKGSKSVVLQTHGAQDVLANIAAIFGSRQSADLLLLKSPFESGKLNEESLRSELQSDIGDTTQISREDVERLNDANFQLEGYVSSCSHGSGRSSKDRQFFFVNSRPCDPKNISKVVNEVYHRYNVHQYPFVYLNIITARIDVDVNLTPDKRQLLLNNEKILLLALKKSLLNTYGDISSTFKLQNTTIANMLELNVKEERTTTDPTAAAVAAANDPSIDCEDDVPITSSQRFMDVLTQWKHTGDTKGIAPHVSLKRRNSDEELNARTLKLQKIQDFLTREEKTNLGSICKSDEEDEPENEEKNELTSLGSQEEQSLSKSKMDLKNLLMESNEFDALMKSKEKSLDLDSTVEVKRIDCKVFPKSHPTILGLKPGLNDIKKDFSLKLSQSSNTSIETVSVLENGDPIFDSVDTQDDEAVSSNYGSQLSTQTFELDDSLSESEKQTYLCGELRISLSEIEERLKVEENLRTENRKKTKLERLRFKSEIKPNQNTKAEAELQKEIAKTDFARMEIIGQFNLGFIIVKLDDDLFIVDQHATDEKYNFETLQQTTVLEYQKLAVPQALDLTAINEMVLMDHLPVFEKNGFKFEINENAPATKKIRLLGKPMSKNWEFGKSDIDELIFMLHDAPEGTVCRPSRVRDMFASRACRKSVMIGKALNKATMRKLINHMGEIEQPWNCPHGRPTIRHLINFTMLMDESNEEEI